MVEISVVVPAYQRPDLLALTVRALLAQDLEPERYEVTVVDSSPDDVNQQLVELLQTQARCRLCCLRKPPQGPGPSRNLGAAKANGAVIAFIDSDCVAAPGWLRAGLAAMNADPRLGLVQGRTIPDPAVPMRSLTRSVRVEAESPIYETANMFYRRSAFEQSGGFPVDASPHTLRPLGGEDTDLAWDVKRLGWRSAFAVDALVMHAVLPITPKQWLIDRPLFVFPRMVARHPQLRAHLFARYFYDDAQAWLLLGLAGTLLAGLSPWTLLAWLPYVWRRSSDATRAAGPLRLLRPLLYLPRDLCTMGLLLAGSLRFGALLL